MITNKKNVQICNGVNFTCIPNEKFKTSSISFTMFLPLKEDMVSKNAIFPNLLEHSCERYPSLTALNKKLADLYGASVIAGADKIGDFQVLTISISCINDKFALDDEKIIFESANLLCDLIFHPVLENGKFRESDILQEKRQLIETIDSEYNDKRVYSKLRCEQLMCKNEKYGINKYGTKEQVEALSSEDVYYAWKNALETAQIEIMMIGNNDYGLIVKRFQDEFKNINRENARKIQTEVIRSCEKHNEYKDMMELKQSKLVMGFRTGIALPDDEVPAMRLMTALLGGTPSSKLFLNVREKMSLCYYCSSNYNKNKGIMLIESGVEHKNIEAAKGAILNQIEQIKDGDFSDEQLESTKRYLSQMFEKVNDSISSLDDWYVLQSINEKINTPEQAIEEINKVNREDVINAAKKLTLDTIYILTSKEEN